MTAPTPIDNQTLSDAFAEVSTLLELTGDSEVVGRRKAVRDEGRFERDDRGAAVTGGLDLGSELELHHRVIGDRREARYPRYITSERIAYLTPE